MAAVAVAVLGCLLLYCYVESIRERSSTGDRPRGSSRDGPRCFVASARIIPSCSLRTRLGINFASLQSNPGAGRLKWLRGVSDPSTLLRCELE